MWLSWSCFSGWSRPQKWFKLVTLHGVGIEQCLGSQFRFLVIVTGAFCAIYWIWLTPQRWQVYRYMYRYTKIHHVSEVSYESCKEPSINTVRGSIYIGGIDNCGIVYCPSLLNWNISQEKLYPYIWPSTFMFALCACLFKSTVGPLEVSNLALAWGSIYIGGIDNYGICDGLVIY